MAAMTTTAPTPKYTSISPTENLSADAAGR